MCSKAVSEISLFPKEELFTDGTPADRVYFLAKGTMTYHHRHAAENVNRVLKEDQWACEAVLWVPWIHFGCLIATRHCEIISMKGKQFRSMALFHFPSLLFVKSYADIFIEEMARKESDASWATDIFMDVETLESMVFRATP